MFTKMHVESPHCILKVSHTHKMRTHRHLTNNMFNLVFIIPVGINYKILQTTHITWRFLAVSHWNSNATILCWTVASPFFFQTDFAIFFSMSTAILQWFSKWFNFPRISSVQAANLSGWGVSKLSGYLTTGQTGADRQPGNWTIQIPSGKLT